MYTTVDSSAALLNAIKLAKPGDTIALKPGNYGTIALSGVNFSSAVTITSTDPAREAVVSGINLSSSSGLTFKNLEVTMEAKTGYAVTVGNSSNIVFDNLDVHGKAVGDGNGAMVRNSNNVTIQNSEFSDIGTGISHIDSNNVLIKNNSIHDLQADAIHGGGTSNITIAGNQFTNFFPAAGDHPDAIQFWTTYTKASASNIVVKDNVFVRGTGEPAQGIFMGNEWSLNYKNVTITGNAIIGGMYNGIAVTMADGVKISGNLVEGYRDMNSWISVSKSTGVAVDNNEATSFASTFGLPGITTWGNATIPLGAIGDTSLLKDFLSNSGTELAQPLPVAASPDPKITRSDADADGRIVGTSAADVLGHAGAQTMSGGAGNDIYLVDDFGDKITEVGSAMGGIDTVRAIISKYTLPTGVENLQLTGTGAQVGIGNDMNNVMTTNGIRSELSGGAGNDTLISLGGTDTLTGGAGADVFRFDKLPVNPVKVTDFVAGVDKLDLSNLLDKYTGSNPVADGWVKFTLDGTSTAVQVDIDGPKGSAGFVTVAKLNALTSVLKAGTDWLF